jgi:hypothetical protein
LAKGGHYYNIPDLDKQVKVPVRGLLPGMHRFIEEGYSPLLDDHTAINLKVKTLLEDAKEELKPKYFTPELWKQLAPILKDIQADSRRLGELQKLTLVEYKVTDQEQSYLYLIEYENFIILQRFGINDKNLVSNIKSEAFEPNSK